MFALIVEKAVTAFFIAQIGFVFVSFIAPLTDLFHRPHGAKLPVRASMEIGR